MDAALSGLKARVQQLLDPTTAGPDITLLKAALEQFKEVVTPSAAATAAAAPSSHAEQQTAALVQLQLQLGPLAYHDAAAEQPSRCCVQDALELLVMKEQVWPHQVKQSCDTEPLS
jgi:hypothetical protein